MSIRVNLDHITIVLQGPRYPENIGSAARAICNMGISRLIVVNPENWDPRRIRLLATHAAAHVVAEIEPVDNLKEALAPFNYVVGTTARRGRHRQMMTPRTLAEHLVPISRENQVAIVFGPEDRGLTNEDLQLCHGLINIPTADFSSLNLAQAAMVVCYELHAASLKAADSFAPRLASRHELDGMYQQLKDILINIDYIKPDNPDYWMHKIRQFGTRMQLKAREVSIIRGMCRQINWAIGHAASTGEDLTRRYRPDDDV
jgi:tRNA/rRNA methyltransferase